MAEGKMDQKEREAERRVEFYVLPLLGGAIVGFIIAKWIGISGIFGTLIGAFVVDAFRGLRGTHRFVAEAEHLVQQARNVWEKRKGQESVREAPEDEGQSQPPPQ
jgi:hypothetical protein